jgi:hypothetical protein
MLHDGLSAISAIRIRHSILAKMEKRRADDTSWA